MSSRHSSGQLIPADTGPAPGHCTLSSCHCTSPVPVMVTQSPWTSSPGERLRRNLSPELDLGEVSDQDGHWLRDWTCREMWFQTWGCGKPGIEGLTKSQSRGQAARGERPPVSDHRPFQLLPMFFRDSLQGLLFPRAALHLPRGDRVPAHRLPSSFFFSLSRAPL